MRQQKIIMPLLMVALLAFGFTMRGSHNDLSNKAVKKEPDLLAFLELVEPTEGLFEQIKELGEQLKKKFDQIEEQVEQSKKLIKQMEKQVRCLCEDHNSMQKKLARLLKRKTVECLHKGNKSLQKKIVRMLKRKTKASKKKLKNGTKRRPQYNRGYSVNSFFNDRKKTACNGIGSSLLPWR